MKKALKITGISLLIIIALLIASPFIFQSQIKEMVKRFINENLNAKVEFSDVSLSFIKSFPQAHVSVDDLAITNFEPFKGDTLVSAKKMAFTMSIKELFKKANDPIIVKSIHADTVLLNLKTNASGAANYDITKEKENASTESSSFAFDIQDYQIKNSTINYLSISDESKIALSISELNHEGKGTFSSEKSELDTKSEAKISFTMDSTNYLNNNPIKLDALIGLDLENSKYTFKENKGFINKLPIEFHGFVQLLEAGQDVDITFENPESSFKNFLAVIPEAYSKNIETVETTGDFKIKGIIKGLVTDETIPTLDISIKSNNASFKYPDLPKRVENIIIDTEIKNTTGKTEDTYVAIKTLNFKIDQDVFKSSATIKNITGNMLVDADIDGVINLGNIAKVYPVDFKMDLSGILKAKLNTAFDMDAIDKNAYERIKNSGSMSLSNFKYASEDFKNPLQVSDAAMTFNPETVTLNTFKALTGKTDLNATGTIKNLLGFMLSNKTLQGNFNLNSNTFAVNDFMSDDVATPTETESDKKPASKTESIKIPAFLDCTINAQANTVIYDNLQLKNAKGALIIKDEQVQLQNFTTNLFDGQLALSGFVSTKTETPTFSMDLGINSFDIAKSFQGMELFQNLAPLMKVIQGKLNSTLNLKGNLTDDFTPNLNSLSGNALAEILSSTINPSKAEILNKLENSLNFVDFKKLNLNDLKTRFDFNNGKVSVKPFKVKYEDIEIEIAGAHGFDKTMAYNAIFNVPAKYLGSEVTSLIAKIDDASAKNITVPITATIGGSYTNPTVKTDLTSGVSNLTKQLVEIQKQKLLNQGKDKVSDMLGDIISGNKTKKDSATTSQNNAVKEVLGGIVGGNKTTTDTTKTNTTKDAVKNVLGGLLSKKKQKDTVQ
ncbi:AsmA family protein [Mariniflexile rhizosphaerae]|uniref:AsmA-like C-terminal region-containing protein n=1 Tax=unclassified Mariniflexile TaxID=2643887 RepID=UPI000CBE672E|nr:AsmA-like C-terminal region-containing protein [Mariniflexile sp. TRM1-10]AXP81103.1 AsmA family protein [Mariniflexile sp. TRM1-10]PLB18720.1 MAG: Outer membrane protein [Flavobacteriaceae bacterium FS1-H7996/R]